MPTNHETIDTGIAAQIGTYSDAIRVGPGQQWLFTSGTPGLAGEKPLSNDIRGQSEKAWENILAALGKAGMDMGDVVKVTSYLTRQEDIRPYAEVRKRYLGSARPASMLLVVPALVWPEILVEIEIIAAKK